MHVFLAITILLFSLSYIHGRREMQWNGSIWCCIPKAAGSALSDKFNVSCQYFIKSPTKWGNQWLMRQFYTTTACSTKQHSFSFVSLEIDEKLHIKYIFQYNWRICLTMCFNGSCSLNCLIKVKKKNVIKESYLQIK